MRSRLRQACLPKVVDDHLQEIAREIAAKDSPLHMAHKVYLDAVTVPTPPEDYGRLLTFA